MMTITLMLIAFATRMLADPTTDACSTVHGAGSCCRIVVSDPIGDATPIERVVCGNQ